MATIQGFINEISPSSDEITQISTSGNTIRETIEGKLDFVSSSKLTGSYIRKTKISPIDDLDIIFKLNCGNATYIRKDTEQKEAKIHINEGYYENHPLKDYTTFDNGKYYISPTKILNKIKTVIKDRYPQTTDIAKRGECITTYFPSYDLTIDCMPYTGVSGETYILIPTSGNDLYWKKSNPDMDKEKINELDDENHFNGKLKGVIKVMKYWNIHKNHGITFRSYILECLVYDILKNKTDLSDYISILKKVIEGIYHTKYKVVIDIPGYDYLYFGMKDEQWETIKTYLSTLYSKLDSEDNFISYLKS